MVETTTENCRIESVYYYVCLYYSEVAGLFLIEPAIESLLDNDNTEEPTNTPQGDTESQLKWPEYWNTKLVPSSQGQWLSAAVGFTRLELMFGLRSPVEEPSLQNSLPKDVVLRKVIVYPCPVSFFKFLMSEGQSVLAINFYIRLMCFD